MTDAHKTTASTLKGLVDLLLANGYSSSELVESIGLSPSVFDSPQATISLPQSNKLWQLAYEIGGETLGIDVGSRIALQQLQSVGVLVGATDNAVAWMNELDDFAPLLSDVTCYRTHFGRSGLSVEITHPLPLPLSYERLEYVAIAGPTLLAQHFGRPISLSEVALTRPKPVDPKPWDDAFGVTVKWGAPTTRVVVGYMDATRILVTRNPQVRQSLKAILSSSLKSREAEQPVEAIKAEILQQLPNADMSLHTVANVLAVSPRALQRKLKSAGASFSGLQSQLRTDVAKQYLQQGMSVAEVASKVGYSDTSVFHRAFKNWTGETPAQYAQKQQATD